MAKVPVKTITISGHVFDVREDGHLVVSDDCHAAFDPRRMEVRYDSGEPESVLRMHILHELLHAAYWVSGPKNLDGKDEETVVIGLSQPLHQILRANEELTQWLLS